tara:strand:+ start:79 stop:528 length:450 start_codon:yes stop_codon:yes gene_type:complete
MSEYITTLQNKIDETKQNLTTIDEYATLSGLNMLPRNWIVEPYIFSSQTGISPKLNENNDVVGFSIEYNIKVKKHYIDESPCYSECSNTIRASVQIAAENWKPIADYSEGEKSLIAEQSKVDGMVEQTAIKQAEYDFLNGTLQHILKED